jgi:uncharacterized membrane protein
LGVAHLLAGIVFFFAYNWDDLTPFAKFAILQSGIIISVVAAMFAKLERLVGQVLLIAGSVLVGGLFAVIGQVYQTGADAFDLFATWAILIVPWVVASRSATHWFVWLVIVYVAFNLFAFQVLMPVGTLSAAELSCLLALATTTFLAMRELAVRAGAVWLEAGWTRRVLALAALAMVFVPHSLYRICPGSRSPATRRIGIYCDCRCSCGCLCAPASRFRCGRHQRGLLRAIPDDGRCARPVRDHRF